MLEHSNTPTCKQLAVASAQRGSTRTRPQARQGRKWNCSAEGGGAASSSAYDHCGCGGCAPGRHTERM